MNEDERNTRLHTSNSLNSSQEFDLEIQNVENRKRLQSSPCMEEDEVDGFEGDDGIDSIRICFLKIWIEAHYEEVLIIVFQEDHSNIKPRGLLNWHLKYIVFG